MKKILLSIMLVMFSVILLAGLASAGSTPKVCGDGILHPSEGCDDGNTINGDGCSSTCNIETAPTCNDNQGAIWTTTGSCGDPQDANHYNIGDKVYVNVKNFCSTYDWDITGLPGGASCDPSTVVISGTKTVNPDGSLCFEAYTVQADDCGEYKVSFDGKHDNYRVDLPTMVPEFGLVAGLTTVLGALGVFFFVRKK